MARRIDTMGDEAYLYFALILFVLYAGLWLSSLHVPTVDPKDPEDWLDRRSIDEYHPTWTEPILDIRGVPLTKESEAVEEKEIDVEVMG